VGCSCNYNKYF